MVKHLLRHYSEKNIQSDWQNGKSNINLGLMIYRVQPANILEKESHHTLLLIALTLY